MGSSRALCKSIRWSLYTFTCSPACSSAMDHVSSMTQVAAGLLGAAAGALGVAGNPGSCMHQSC